MFTFEFVSVKSTQYFYTQQALYMSPAIFLLLIILSFFKRISTFTTTPPLWKSNPYISTGQANVKTDITTLFNQASPITKTFTFLKTYTQVPQVAYAIKNYRGNDRLVDEDFQITQTALTTFGFTLNVALFGWTNVRIFTVLYMAVDKAFPYHLNVFGNIQVNHTNGALTDISTTFVGIRTYTNTINYTTLASTIGSIYTKFGPVLSTNNVALYISGQSNEAQTSISPLPKVKFDVITQILSTDQFQIKVVVDQGYKIHVLKFGIVAFDVADVEKSGEYTIVFTYSILTATVANNIPLAKQFQDSAFIGIVDFSALSPFYGMEFNWQFDPNNNQIIVNKSTPYSMSTALGGLNTYQIAIFYVKTWYCPTSSFYDPITKLCNIYACGDGDWVVGHEDCDDGNLVNFDGCSSTCTVETGFECLVADKLANGSSFCKYTQNVTVSFSTLQKSPTSNSISIFFTLEPALLSDWNSSTIQSLITSVQIQSLTTPGLVIMSLAQIVINYNPNSVTDQIELVVNYDTVSIENTQLAVTISPSNTNIPSIIHLPAINFSMTISSASSAVPFYSYPPTIYEFKNSGVVKILSQIIGFAALVLMLVGFLLPVGKLIIVEKLAVVQISFFSLLQLNKMPPTYDDLKYLTYSTGYFDLSQLIPSTQATISSSVYSVLGLKDLTLMNYNLSIGLFALPVIVGLIAIGILKICNITSKNQQPSDEQEKFGYHNQVRQDSAKPVTKAYDNQVVDQAHKNDTEQIISSRTQVMSQIFKRITMESGMYGMLICGYLLWVTVLHSVNLSQTQNTIVSVLFGLAWLGIIILFVIQSSSPPLFLQKHINWDQESVISLKNPQTLTTFGEFRSLNSQISTQKQTNSSFLERIYLLLILERPLSAFVIVYLSTSLDQSPAIILVLFVILFILLNIAYQMYQRNLPEEKKKSLFSYLYQNYTLRQSINFLTIIAVQSLFLVFESQRKSQGDQFVLAKSDFTIKTFPILLLSFLVANIAVNLIFLICEIINSQILTKTKLLFKILLSKTDESKISSKDEVNNTSQKDKKKYQSTKSSKIEKQSKISLLKQESELQYAMNEYLHNSKIFNHPSSPFEGVSEKQGGSKLLKIQKINEETKVKVQKPVDYLYEAKNKGYYNKVFDQI